MADTARILSTKQRQLLEARLREKREHSRVPTIPRREGSDALPLSFAQERFWVLDQLDPGGAEYNIPLCLRLKGQLDEGILKECLNRIVARHESLRTRFLAEDGRPRQSISSATPLEIPLVDATTFPEARREAEVMRLCVAEVSRPFELRQGPLLRAKLLRLGQEDHILAVTMHHIASDEWSVGVLLRELKTLYQALCSGTPSPLAELPIQYADYAIWQRELLSGEVLERQLDYWKNQLQGAPFLLELPADRPRPTTQSHRGAVVVQEFSKDLLHALRGLSRREGGSLFMTLMAAFQTLLHRYTGLNDILVGSAIAGRNRTELEGLIGFFVNTLVFRGDLSGNPSFRDLLGRTREVALGAYAHQDLPFEKLVGALHPERNLSHSPLIQVMFVLQNVPVETANLQGLEVSPVQLATESAQFDLTFEVHERAECLEVLAEFSTDLFDESRITRMLGHYQVLLEGIVGNPDRRLAELPVLTGAERNQILLTPNGKVDGIALPPPDLKQVGSERYSAPYTPTQKVLAGIWSEVLGVMQVGVRDNFFELGGHCLLAARLLSRVRRVFELDLPLQVFFEAPTVEGMETALVVLSAVPNAIRTRAEELLNIAGLSGEETDANAMLSST
jgi:hypothetical protein